MNTKNINIIKKAVFVSDNYTRTNDIIDRAFKRTSLLRMYRIATSIFFFIAGLTFATWASRIPDIQHKLQLSDGGLGAVLFSLPVGLMLSLPISGWMVNRYGSKRIVIAAAVFYPLILLLLAMAGSVFQLSGALFLFGMLGNLINIAMNTQAVGIEKLYGRSVMASFHGLWSLAGFTGALIGTFFVSAGLSPLFHFSIVCLAVISLVIASYKFTLPHDNGDGQTQKLFTRPDKKIFLLGLIGLQPLMRGGNGRLERSLF